MIRLRYIIVWVLAGAVGISGLLTDGDAVASAVLLLLVILGVLLHTIDSVSRLRANREGET